MLQNNGEDARLSDPLAPKIVKTDASDLGYSGILKQVQDNKEQILQYTFAHWNDCQKNYSTIKKEILSIVLCITKFQIDLLNQKFLLRVDCKSAKEVLQKDVQNLASKQIFARWQAIHGLTRIYRRFVKYFSIIAAPLTEIVKKIIDFK